MAKRRSSSIKVSKEAGRVRKKSADSSSADESNPFMVTDVQKQEEVNTRKNMHTSEEIKVFNVGDAPVIDYVKDQKQDIMEYDEKSEVIELSADSMEHVDVSVAKTVELDGKSKKKDFGKKHKADFKSLKSAKIDERKSFSDIKRNIDEYRPMCRSCRNTLKCGKCDGKGKIMFMRKCPDCGGSGMCSRCSERESVRCPNCGRKLSFFASNCSECGTSFSCPQCYSPIPPTATRCLNCHTEFSCKNCRNTIAPAIESKCVRCGTEKWLGRPKRELPIRKEEVRSQKEES